VVAADHSPTTRRPLDGATDLCRLSALELAQSYAAKAVSPVEVARACLARAEAINPHYAAFTSIDHETALAAAAESEARWHRGEPASPIDGVPATIKDIVWVAGKTIRYGSVAADPVVPDRDCPVVERLRAAGAILLGLTALPEFGWKAVTDGPLSGLTRNPWNDALTPGGSSGGAAVAAAMGAGVLHLGTDGGGSIRIPASFTGIVGHKPTFGVVPAYPPSAFGTVAHLGPMARSVDDARRMLMAVAGRHALDWYQPPAAFPPLEAHVASFRGMKLGYWRTPPCGPLDPQTAACCDGVVGRLAAAGANVAPVALPDMDVAAIFQVLWFSAAAQRLRGVPRERHGLIDPGFLEIAAAGEVYSAADHVAANSARAEFGRRMDALFDQHELIVSPATSIPAFAVGHTVPPGSGLKYWTQWAGFSFPVNLGQHPACVIPCGFTDDGRPIGLQIFGPRGGDAQVLAAAEGIERGSA
jgi:amidase/aspartyl-tRNA(Asn)/glutamyl-tRNA(Gln) amidotransferase subunit A